MTDLTRDRKVRVSRSALWFLLVGLVLCLAAAAFKPEIAAALAGYYAGYCAGVAGVLAFFANANARVHEAQAKAPPTAGFARLGWIVGAGVLSALVTLAIVWPWLWWVYLGIVLLASALVALGVWFWSKVGGFP